MDVMAKLLKKHKKLVHEIAEKNTIRDKNGSIVFKKDDPWGMDDTWDALYEEISRNEGNTA